MFNIESLMINEDSFGDNCPNNWAEIATTLNDKIMEKIGSEKPETFEDAKEIASAIWEDFCNNDTLSRFEMMISLNNGATFLTVDDLEEHRQEILERWNVIASYMEDDVRESIVYDLELDDEIEFLAEYLRRAHYDLVIG